MHWMQPHGIWIFVIPAPRDGRQGCPYVELMSPRAPEHEVSLSEAGSEFGPVVLLVHGIGVSGRYFAPLIQALSNTHHVIAPDLPGFGASWRPRTALTIIEQASVLETALELRTRTGVILVGHSMGAQVVTELAARNPALARGVVLIGPVTEPPTRPAPQLWRLLRDLPREPAAINALVLRDYLRGVRAFAGSLPHMLKYPLAERLSVVTAPLVLVRGERDPIASLAFLHSLAAAAGSGASRVVEIPAAGHVTIAIRPDLVAELCRGPW